MTALQTAKKGGSTGPGSILPPGGAIVPPNGPMLPPGMRPPGLPGMAPGANSANASAANATGVCGVWGDVADGGGLAEGERGWNVQRIVACPHV
jgi:hypothetical protein